MDLARLELRGRPLGDLDGPALDLAVPLVQLGVAHLPALVNFPAVVPRVGRSRRGGKMIDRGDGALSGTVRNVAPVGALEFVALDSLPKLYSLRINFSRRRGGGGGN